MRFSEAAWARSKPSFDKILRTPFAQGLVAGTLDPVRFKGFVVQDVHFLTGMERALASSAARGSERPAVARFFTAADRAMKQEHALKLNLFHRLDLCANSFSETSIDPTCYQYISYLQASAQNEPAEIFLATFLPCLWVFAEVGRDLKGRSVDGNPYQPWIDSYAGLAYADAMHEMLQAVDAVAAEASETVREEMLLVYVASAELEYTFWQSACTEELWPAA
ncbi:TenA family protein [Acuticoccus sp. I52.16.1]|uniref:TenA family protein n=1 Tax=Acuticoccus sp. I52.16.1 TaxID=2928472 RepID=UPI001FD28151|nr:TenA family protein [Acuticoccus sp. I52.16.1]UOM35781.1 TenA family protein [Acuticoccus sp. I52.16.1]